MDVKIFRVFHICIALMLILVLAVILLNPLDIMPEKDNTPEGIISRVNASDIAILSDAQKVSAQCDTKECSVYKIFRHIQSNDASTADKSTLFASYLANIGIDVKIAFTESSESFYIMAAGIDRERLYHLLAEDAEPFHTERTRLAANQIWTKVPFEDETAIIAIKASSSGPVSINATRSAYEIYAENSILKECSVKDTQSFIQICSLPAGAAFVIHASGDVTIDISLAKMDLSAHEIPSMLYRGQYYTLFDLGSNIWQKDTKLANVKIMDIRR